MAARRLRAAVVGAGRLGTLHARKYAAMPEVELRAIVDVDLARAEELARELHAAASGHLLQIGHLERFNPAIVHLRSILDEPRFIECHRLALFTERGLDVD